MKSLLALLTLVILNSCTPVQDIVPKTSGGAINSSAPFLWYSSAFPIDLRISNDFSAEEVSNIRAMTAAWETAVNNQRDFFTDTNRTDEVSSPSMNLDTIAEDSVFGVYKIIHWPLDLSSSALAVAQLLGVRHNVGTPNEHVRIVYADILLNEHLYDFRTGGGPDGVKYDLQTVMLHELGHFLGLLHKTGDLNLDNKIDAKDTTVMAPSIGTDTTLRTPTSDIDAKDLANKYGIKLLSSSVSSMSSSKTKKYIPTDQGKKVKIIMELMPDGECIHKEDGFVTKRHSM